MAKINPIDIGVTTRKIRKNQPAHWNVLGARITSHVKPMGWRRNGRSLVHFFMGSDERTVWRLNSTFGSSHSASSAYQKCPTKALRFVVRLQLSNSI